MSNPSPVFSHTPLQVVIDSLRVCCRLGLLIGALAACERNVEHKTVQPADTAQGKKTALRVPTWPLVKKNWAAGFVGHGSFEKLDALEVRAPLAGVVLEVQAGVGAAVEYGDVLLRLDDQPQAAEFAQADSVRQDALEKYRLAALKLSPNYKATVKGKDKGKDKASDIHPVGNGLLAQQVQLRAREQLQQSRRELAAADRSFQRAMLALLQTELSAPLGATVSEVNVLAGATVAAGQVLMRLQPRAGIAALVQLPKAAAANAATDVYWPGQVCRVKSAALRGESFSGTVQRIHIAQTTPDASASAAGQSFAAVSALVVMDNPQQRLKPGMPARVQCEGLWRDHALVVPRKALLPASDDAVADVYVLREGLAELRQPVFGDGDAENVPLLAGLEEGEQLIIAKQQMLEPGLPVQVLKWVQVTVKDEF